jgi:hypothetical protein
MFLTEKVKWVPMLNSANVSTGSDTDSLNMSGYHSSTWLFMFGTVTTDITITPTTGATEGAKTTAIVCYSAIGGAVIGTAVAASTASCDVLSAWTNNATAVSVTAASNKFVVVEVDHAQVATAGHNWLTMTVAAGTSGICYCVVAAVPRFAGYRTYTALK